ncbi:hypothetical protein [Microbacterium sp. CIAB417]|uniref:hypothetical protein n=1 Tax=Microbacterium sp. CIAB417 TaxID=2860287 RepID=UPI001FAB9428|nr:hypothetical protein [Microbacterium sp. CIAB417]
MSTSDSPGKEPLTRKQLREIRLTGATPVITENEEATPPPAPVLPRAAEPAPVAPAPVPDDAVDLGAAPLTRRQAREQERIRTASVPVIGAEDPAASPAEPETSDDDAGSREAKTAATETEIVSAVPVFAPTPAKADDGPLDSSSDAPEDESEDETEALLEPGDSEPETAEEADAGAAADQEAGDEDEDTEADLVALGVDADVIEDTDDAAEHGERPTVNPTFGQSVLAEEKTTTPFTPSFDELITVSDSTGSQHIAPSALIFNPPPGDGSLSGPVASTGEVLITGTYELPEGLGSQGHAKGVADGKDVDAVLIDGELPPASSPTPIAASSAVSTIKPAGEVIRPPAPEKGNRLMLTLAITAGGLALALATALIIAFTTNVL